MWASLFAREARNLHKLALGGGSVLLGSVLLTQEQKPQAGQEWRLEHAAPALKTTDGVKLARKITSDVDKTGLNLRLYQYQTCPYCCKVRAFLDYYGFAYEVVEVNPVTRSQLKKVAQGYKKVPVVTSSEVEKPLVESSLIVSLLSTFLLHPKVTLDETQEFYPAFEKADQDGGKPKITYPNQYFVMHGENRLTQSQIQNAREEREWREWVDDHFIHLISPNVYRTWNEALETFYYFDQVGDWQKNFPAWERWLAVYVGAAAMYLISKKLKKKHRIDDERVAIFQACEKFVKAKGDRPFLGGNEPNLADLALFGAINSFVGCSAFKEMREQTKIGDWYDAVHKTVVQRQGSKAVAQKSKAIAA
ncbi:Protein R11A8.5 [Aphelenchoides avenae]|nr:Protein R11A8.5 [Aphelenchus avenae]